MIGRKIIDYSLVGCDSLEPVSASGLRPPGLKPCPLTINIDMVNSSKALWDHAETPRAPDSLTPHISSSSPYTPNTSHTFGVPNPTSVTSSEDTPRSRRRQRYSLAEQALASTLQSSSTASSSRELQIRVLEQATTLLGAHAIDAQERAGRRRPYSVDENHEILDPESFESLERQRQVEEEKRQAAVDFESKMLREHLLSLTQFFENQGVEDRSVSEEDRRLANLARFFQASLTETSFTAYGDASKHMDWSIRRRTLTEGLVARLASVNRRCRSRSLDERDPRWRRRERQVRSLLLRGQSSLTVIDASVITGDPLMGKAFQPPSPPPFSSSLMPSNLLTQSIDRMHESANPRCTTVRCQPLPEFEEVDLWDHVEGVATIFKPSEALSREDILSNMPPHAIELPDYAKELIADFDCTHDCVNLRRDISPLRCCRPPSVVSVVQHPHADIHMLSLHGPVSPSESPPSSIPSPTLVFPLRPPSPSPPPTRSIRKKSSCSHLSSFFSRFRSSSSQSLPTPQDEMRKERVRKRSFLTWLALGHSDPEWKRRDDVLDGVIPNFSSSQIGRGLDNKDVSRRLLTSI